MADLLFCIILVYIIISAMLTFYSTRLWSTGEADVWNELYNPFVIYKRYNVNIFGCFLLMLLGHLLVPVGAPIFWLAKLCTVGRK